LLDLRQLVTPYARGLNRSRRFDRALLRPAFVLPTGPAVVAFDRGAVAKERQMATGVVKWFNMTKGFGFIAPDGGGQDVFVHVSAVERSGLNGLREGQAVSFDVENDPRKNKPSAVNIKAV
jgi:CspA family cold shock protein